MSEMTFAHPTFAAGLRDLIRRMIAKEVELARPADRYGAVTSIDYVGRRALVTLTGASRATSHAFGAFMQPTHVGQTVRVSGRPGDRYVASLSDPAPWVPIVAFSGGWASATAPYGAPAYRRDQRGRVWLRGAMRSGASASTAFTLPADYRPTSTRVFAVIQGGGITAQINVDSSGNVTPQNVTSNTLVSLDQITFDTS